MVFPTMADAQTPILVRLDRLRAQLESFQRDPAARLLCWVLAPDEERLFDALVAERSAEQGSPVTFLSCTEPFSTPSGHGVAVTLALEQDLDLENSELESRDVYDIAWTPPAPPDRLKRTRGQPAPDQCYLVSVLASLRGHLCPRGEPLTLCLRPEAVGDPKRYASWLSELAALLDDPELRVVAPSRLDSPLPSVLASARPDRVRLIRADLDMPGALAEIAAAAEDESEPSGRFRTAFVQASTALGRQEGAQAQQYGKLAAKIAESERWPHLEFAVHQLLGAGALSAGDPVGAFTSFEAAERVTVHDLRAGPSFLTPLLLQARLGKGSAAVAAGAFARGAQVFESEALPVARLLEDRRMELECRRMASYCEERSGNTSAAWKQAVAATLVGASLPPEERRSTTLPFVGQSHLRLLKGLGHGRQRDAIHRKFSDLLGSDWQSLLEPGLACAQDMESSPLGRQDPEGAAGGTREGIPSALMQEATLPGTDPVDPTLEAPLTAELIEQLWGSPPQAAEAEPPRTPVPPAEPPLLTNSGATDPKRNGAS